ncbi:chitooligosaccharide deacetylase [Paenibacillus polymyxa]|uniref:polysaccharide deacetylase family protein n=1 Tax=Paenibacillus polymyxa TaxID=1406 RepID=UPI0005CE8C82|nr:polysaccharide deacetylase family protein [Paenibacillus polymyxa]KJD40686.1 chitooligosaccharide deacetylase [Paenibacillus polymyxa]
MRYRGVLPCLALLLAFSSFPVHADTPPNIGTPHPKEATVATSVYQSKDRATPTLAMLRKKHADIFKMCGPHTRQIALTFDDVPDSRYTPQVLDVLHANGIKATFFIVGHRAEKHPGIIRRIIREGHAIGNHSYTHPDFRKATPERFRHQITKTERILEASAGFRPRLIRPPYGEITEPQIQWARHHGYMIVNWNVDSLDWKGLSKTQIQRNVIPATGPGSIILMHAGGGQSSNLQGTVQALPGLIHSLKAKGYKFVTVPRLLHTSERK